MRCKNQRAQASTKKGVCAQIVCEQPEVSEGHCTLAEQCKVQKENLGQGWQVKACRGRKVWMWDEFGWELLLQGLQGFVAARAAESSKAPQLSPNRARGICPCSSRCVPSPSSLQLPPGTLCNAFCQSLGLFDCLRGLFGVFFFFWISVMESCPLTICFGSLH